MPHSESIKEIAKALASAQKSLKHAAMNAVNPGFKRGNEAAKYADLSDVIDAIREPFAANGLSYVQLTKPHADALVETLLMHESGEWISSEIQIPVSNKTAQGYGSALTYARRYGLSALAGVAQADDDGAGAGTGQDETTEKTLANFIAAIESADTLPELQETFAKGQKALKTNRKAITHLINAKDVRKKALSQEAA